MGHSARRSKAIPLGDGCASISISASTELGTNKLNDLSVVGEDTSRMIKYNNPHVFSKLRLQKVYDPRVYFPDHLVAILPLIKVQWMLDQLESVNIKSEKVLIAPNIMESNTRFLGHNIGAWGVRLGERDVGVVWLLRLVLGVRVVQELEAHLTLRQSSEFQRVR